MISIIIPVKNDRKIEDTLKSLEKVKKPEKTEIVVVDASKKETLLDIRKKFPKVRWFYYENKTRKKITISEQRNLGIKKSKGDIIAFIDAGCTADRDWLINLTKPLFNNKEFYSTGYVKPLEGRSIHDLGWDKIKGKYRDGAGTANTALKKIIFKKVALFDESFEAGEDIDFSWRVIDAGYKIRYVSDAIIYNDWGNFKTEIKRGIKYGEARVNLYIKHPNKLKNLLNFNDDLYTLYTIGFFFYILFLPIITVFWPYYPLFLLVPLIKNIKINPLKKMVFDWFWGLGVIVGLWNLAFNNHANKKN